MTPIIATVICLGYLLVIHYIVWEVSKDDRCPEDAREVISTNYFAFMAFTIVLAFLLPFHLVFSLFSKKKKEDDE